MNKKLSNVLVVAVIAFAVGGAVYLSYNQGASDQQAAIAGHKTNPAPTSAASTNNQEYSQLVQQYKTARIQFKQSCQIYPVSSSFKTGTSVMLDNRSSVAHTVSIGSMTYSLPAFGYQIVSLVSSTFPATLNINCDGSISVGKVIISQ